MKVKALLLGLGLVAVAMGAQDTLKFTRTFKEGDSDTFKMHMVASMAMGDADVSMTMKQTVKKVYDNGEADLTTSFPEFKVLFGGNEAPVPGIPESTIHVDKQGMPISKASGMAENMQFSRFASLFYGRDLKVGDSIPIDYTDPKDPKVHTSGTVKVDSVTNGEAKLVESLKVSTPNTDSPMDVDMTCYIDTASSKPNKLEGKVSNMPTPAGGNTPPITSMTFTMERVK